MLVGSYSYTSINQRSGTQPLLRSVSEIIVRKKIDVSAVSSGHHHSSNRKVFSQV